MRVEALALVLIVFQTACRNDTPAPPAEPATPAAASSAGTEVEDPDLPQPPTPADEPDASQHETAKSPQPDAAQPPEASSDATPATAEMGDAPSAGKYPEYPLQDNPLAGCTLCHVDIEDEFVGSLHFEEKVGCTTCHGPSAGHAADENNEVKPDEMFARPVVDRLCEVCHECPRPEPEAPELTADGRRKVCIDCHGPHDVALAADGGPAISP